MSYTSQVQIQETAGELQSTYHKVKDSRVKLKIKALMLFKAGDFKKQEDLAYHLCIGHATLKRWLRKYKNEGLSSYIKEPVRGKPKSLVSPELHKAL